jgi:hypothetical protein
VRVGGYQPDDLIIGRVGWPRRQERLLGAPHTGTDLTDINAVPDAFDGRGLPVIHLARC